MGNVTERNGSVAVIGGGPAGIMAAIRAAESGGTVTLYEKTPRLLNKLRISGKGRCNLTNACDRQEFLGHILRGARFFQSAFSRFDNWTLMDTVEGLGVPLKTERGNRVFPVSDRATDVADALIQWLSDAGVKVVLRSDLRSIETMDPGFQLSFANGRTASADRVIIACGGKSYPATGSTGDGYALARSLGHRIVDPMPSLAPIITEERWTAEAAGLSLRNVGLTAYCNDKQVYTEQGEMLFTHTGVSGPLVLSATCHLDVGLPCRLSIDLKPALSAEQLDARILRDFERYSNREARNALVDLLPRSLIKPVADLWGCWAVTVNQLTRAERMRLVTLLKDLPLTVREIGPIDAAIVTKGGVDLKEVNPRTMESKRCPGVYFAGELLDIDGYTGGFNLQIAFSTGNAAGIACGESLLS